MSDSGLQPIDTTPTHTMHPLHAALAAALIGATTIAPAACRSGDYTAAYAPPDTTPRRPRTRPVPPNNDAAHPPDTGDAADSAPDTMRPQERCNGADGDKDGVVDEGCACAYRDRPGDVCASTRGADGTCRRPEAYEPDETTCDGKDNDCDGEADERCGYKACYLPSGCTVTRTRVGDDGWLYVNASCEGRNRVVIIPESRIRGRAGVCWYAACPVDGVAEICEEA